MIVFENCFLIYNSNPIILGNYDQNNIIYTGRDYSYNNIYISYQGYSEWGYNGNNF